MVKYPINICRVNAYDIASKFDFERSISYPLEFLPKFKFIDSVLIFAI